MKKIIVHHIDIRSKDQKVMFQIRIPRNAIKVTGIKITNNGNRK